MIVDLPRDPPADAEGDDSVPAAWAPVEHRRVILPESVRPGDRRTVPSIMAGAAGKFPVSVPDPAKQRRGLQGKHAHDIVAVRPGT